MKYHISIKPMILMLTLTIGFSGGIIFLALQGSLPSKSEKHVSAEVVSKGHEVLDQFSSAFEDAAAKVNECVVPIFSEQIAEVRNPFASGENPFHDFFGDDFFKRFFGGAENQKQVVRALGSGVIVSRDGYILTNNHVVDGAQKLTVAVGKDKKYTAILVGRDPNTDVAVIKIDAKDLPVAALGNSDNVKVGQWVIAVGNPFQLMHTVTAGIISAKGRASVNLADYEDFIQTDASINPGNSGGALADLDGNVIGINTAIYSPSGGNVGIGFAIPVNMAKRVMDELVSKGKVTRGFLALVPQDLDETLAKAMKRTSTKGALVGDVTEDGPAGKAGIKRGDIVTAIDGKEIENSVDLRNRVAALSPGTIVQMTVVRDGKEQTIPVVLGERPADTGVAKPNNHESRSEKTGMSVQTLDNGLAAQLGYKNEHGVVISSVIPGTPADAAGLQRGDLIKEVNRTPVRSVSEYNKAFSAVKSGETVALLVRRGANTFFVGLEGS